MSPRRRGPRSPSSHTRGRGRRVRARREQGVFVRTRSGLAFVDLDSGGPGAVIEDPARSSVVHGDVGLVLVRKRRQGRPEGEIVRVLERTERRLGGTIATDGAGTIPYLIENS